MSCLNNCNCECFQIENINQCDQVLTFDLGILNAERDLKFNITGRSKRIYQIEVTTDADGVAEVNIESLPVGYISSLFDGIYKVWFTNEFGDIIVNEEQGSTYYEFKAVQLII